MTKHSSILCRASLAGLLAHFVAAPFAPADPGVDLRGADLTNADLSNSFLGASIYDGGGGFFWGVDGTDLSGANLSHANLTNIDCRGYLIYNTDDFNGQHLYYYQGALLWGANLTGAQVRGANFTGTGLSFEQISSTANYQAHDLSGIVFGGQYLVGANFAGQNLATSDFSGSPYFFNWWQPPWGSDLTGANLTNTNLLGTSFDVSNLTGADARGAKLSNFGGANQTNMIQPNGRIAGLDLTSGASLVVRDYDGNPTAATGPLPIVVDQHLAMTDGGTLQLIFEADPWNSTIFFAPGIPVARGGTLQLMFSPDVNLASQIGRTIDLFDWTGVTPVGTFAVSSPYTWDLSKLYTSGEVTLSAFSTIPGDFSSNGVVDAADYIVWRKTNATPAGYNAWRTHFGQPPGSSATDSASASPNAIPEPTSLPLFLLAVGALVTSPRHGVAAKNRC
jgi:uncharacterized protein YjbI with pentapeptide repeats